MKIRSSAWKIFSLILAFSLAVESTLVYLYWPRPFVLYFSYQPSTHHIAAFIILEKHWVEEELSKFGFNVIVKEECFGSGPPQMERFTSGVIDVAYVGACPVISEVSSALKKGYPKAVIVAAVNQQGSALVMRKGFSYDGPKSLNGTTIGTFPAGSVQNTILKDWLSRNGLVLNRDVEVREADPRELVSLLESEKVDGIFVPSPSPEICEYRGIGKIVVSSADMVPGHPCCVLILRDSFISKLPGLAELIVKLHLKAERFIIENTDEAISIAAKKLADLWGEDVAFVRTVVERAIEENPTGLSFCSNPHLVVEGIMGYANVLYELGMIEIKPSEGDLFNFTLYDRAVKELSEVEVF